ncbi:diguanylate cyclase domain-containing protein [Microbacterium sp. NPDC058345]|uniref:GGDEF domain-containing protein n=1 Tax=Microbacterium sp. NPDC058345 TaxID=3346455 RepID=UPI00365A11A0
MVEQGIRAADAQDLAWLRLGWLQRARKRTSIYSVVTAIICIFFAMLFVLELTEHDISTFEILLSAGLMLVCLAVAAAVLLAGVRLPQWFGLVMVVAHAAIAVYYLGFSDERQNAVASIQELPVMAMYLAWFYGARIGRIVELIIVVSVSVAMGAGPFGGPAVDGVAGPGLLGPANIIGAVLLTWMCLEMGLFLRHRVRIETHTDELTGALNRRGFAFHIQDAVRRAARKGRPLSIAVLDLDDFKAVNDGEGHDAGDAVLKSVVAQWMSLSRQSDLVGRLGGDEFAMLLPETSAAEAAEMLRRMRLIASHPWSWGIAEWSAGDTADAVLRRADAAMYRDKRGV